MHGSMKLLNCNGRIAGLGQHGTGPFLGWCFDEGQRSRSLRTADLLLGLALGFTPWQYGRHIMRGSWGAVDLLWD
jgi:hypothetical protein